MLEAAAAARLGSSELFLPPASPVRRAPQGHGLSQGEELLAAAGRPAGPALRSPEAGAGPWRPSLPLLTTGPGGPEAPSASRWRHTSAFLCVNGK